MKVSGSTLVGKNQQEYRVDIVMYDLRANMKPIPFLPLAIVLATTSVIGQDTVLHRSPHITPSILMPPRTPMLIVPSGLKVNHGPSFQTRKTDTGHSHPRLQRFRNRESSSP